MQQGSVVVPTISCLSWDVYDARLLNDLFLNALAVFILDTALVHVALVDDAGAVGFGCAKDTPKSLSFLVRSTGGSVCTKVVGGLEVGEARNWHGVLLGLQVSEYASEIAVFLAIFNSR